MSLLKTEVAKALLVYASAPALVVDSIDAIAFGGIAISTFISGGAVFRFKGE